MKEIQSPHSPHQALSQGADANIYLSYCAISVQMLDFLFPSSEKSEMISILLKEKLCRQNFNAGFNVVHTTLAVCLCQTLTMIHVVLATGHLKLLLRSSRFRPLSYVV